jgi:hypothetical protein
MRDHADPAIAAKQRAHERHFRNRVLKRFRIKLTPERYQLWVEKIEQVIPGVELLYQCEQPGRTCWKLPVGGVTLRVIYDETSERLVTALPFGKHELATAHRKKVLRLRGRESAPDPDHVQKKRRMFRTGRWK